MRSMAASRQIETWKVVAPKVAASQVRALAPKDGGGENFTHEQSERLLQQFVQWRQKTALIDKP